MLSKIKLSLRSICFFRALTLGRALTWSGFFLGVLVTRTASGLEAGATPEGFRLADDLSIQIYATGVQGARMMARSDQGTLYVGTRDEGRVYSVRDRDANGIADEVRILLEGLSFPNGLAVIDGDLYVAEKTRIIRVPKSQLSGSRQPEVDVVYDGLPPEPHHGWRALQRGPDGWLYLAIGVPCNSCSPVGPLQGRLIRIHPHDGRLEVLAEGLRNSVGLAFQPHTSILWMTENGRDLLGDDVPPDELNRYEGQPVHYGFPFCYGKKGVDAAFGNSDSCQQRNPPAWEFPAHVAPIGLLFYQGTGLPDRFHGQCLVAQHGSWNRSIPSGYRLVLIRMEQGTPVSETVFAEGWLSDGGKVLGRPVDLLELPDGSLLVSDDHADVIYRISAKKRSED